MIPVGAVVRIKKSSIYYREDTRVNPRCMGVVYRSNYGSYGVQWLSGRNNSYNYHDLEIWLGFTVEEEDQTKADGTYDELFKEYASEKMIELARVNGQYIPGMVITDGGEGNGGSGSGEVQTGSSPGGDIELMGRSEVYRRGTRFDGVWEDESGTINSGLLSQIRSNPNYSGYRPYDFTTESMERFIRGIYQSSSFGYQFDSSPRPTVRDRPVDLGRVSPISVGTIHHRRR